ncbi:hypothetical protein DCS_00116 [Drechmeria coniospora]|uniref:Uncharacterized protein n=1 Tax=Drechmeria coniospora TaxID=98403 RepID=A0A151GPF2_DRECN|nr:hypothetical protein DCS_00116 [Drechmeria coniospora]KYK58989.1 hypothetical protein DCS_00116 [Drechmeria coniospora]
MSSTSTSTDWTSLAMNLDIMIDGVRHACAEQQWDVEQAAGLRAAQQIRDPNMRLETTASSAPYDACTG